MKNRGKLINDVKIDFVGLEEEKARRRNVGHQLFIEQS